MKNIAESLAAKLPGSVSFQELIDAGLEAQDPSEEAQKAFDMGYRYQAGKGVQRDLKRALSYYRQAVKLAPSYSEAYHNLAQVCYDMRRFDLAERFFARYLEFKPNDAQAVHDLGVAFHRQSKLKKAEAQYKRALVLDPEMAQAYYNLGNIYYKRKQEDLALQAYDTAIDLEPENEAFLSKRKTVINIRQTRQKFLSPTTVAWMMRIFGVALIIFFISYRLKKRKESK